MYSAQLLYHGVSACLLSPTGGGEMGVSDSPTRCVHPRVCVFCRSNVRCITNERNSRSVEAVWQKEHRAEVASLIVY